MKADFLTAGVFVDKKNLYVAGKKKIRILSLNMPFFFPLEKEKKTFYLKQIYVLL